MSRFKKAVRRQAKLRMGLDGPSGSGKSYTALRFAFAFEGARVACIEAGENGGLSLYQGDSPDGVPFDFEILELKGNYSPTEYTMAIEEAGRERFDVIVIDSLSHAWAGAGGALEQVGGASFTDKEGWRKVTPQHNRMIDAILQSPCHVIATLRSKTEYILEETTNSKGQKISVPRKVGMAPIQRAGMEYEFTVYGSLDHQHTLTVGKSRCGLIQDAIAHKPGAGFMTPLIRWLDSGEAGEAAQVQKRVGEDQARRLEDLLVQTGWKRDVVARGLEKYGVAAIRQLAEGQATEFEGVVAGWLEKRRLREAAEKAEKAGSPPASPEPEPPVPAAS